MLANNETGIVQPLREVVALAARHDALVHCDAVQALGKIPVNFGLLGVDLLTVSSHKLGGPLGCGALVVRDGLSLTPLIHGGAQETRRRAGTENVPAIAGFAAVLQEKTRNIKILRDDLESRLEGAVVIGRDVDRLPNTICFAQPGMLAETLVMALDLEGIAVSAGSACSSGKVARSHVLAAMGVAPEIAAGAIRASLGWNTTPEDIERFGAAWRRILSRQQSKAAA
jgi:cysteine desulfurase